MLLLGLISWWYSAGWLQLVQRVFAWLQRVVDFFSIELLIKSLLAPYRQISAGSVQGPISMQLHGWFDRQISRVIGALLRLIIIAVGLLAILFVLAVGLLCIFFWPFLPALPLITAVVVFGASR